MQDNYSHLLEIPAEAYHRDSAEGLFLSSHMLGDFRNCPELYHRKITGKVKNSDTGAYTLGRAAHCLILEGRNAFSAQYLISDGPINPKTGAPYGKQTLAYREWVDAQGKEIISESDYGFICKLQEAVGKHAGAAVLLGEGRAEGTVRAEYCGIPCQIRIDWYNAWSGIVDLKTCDDIRFFEPDFRKYGYGHQMAFYRSVLEKATGETVPVHVIAVEKKEPYRCGVWLLSDELLDDYRRENEAAIERLKKCQETDTWPTGYEEIRILTSR